MLYLLSGPIGTLFANNQVVLSGTASLFKWQLSLELLSDLSSELKAHINLCYSNNEKPRKCRPPNDFKSPFSLALQHGCGWFSITLHALFSPLGILSLFVPRDTLILRTIFTETAIRCSVICNVVCY